jgi:hypothetical protein
MNKYEIAELLMSNHRQFIAQIRSLHETDYLFAPPQKWNAAEHLDHINKSVAPLSLALSIPKLFIKWKFGMANRPSTTYEELIAKYKIKLQQGGRASGRFIAAASTYQERELKLESLESLVEKLVRKTVNHSETSLDEYILPHPLMGKLTFREML